jgi:hypothetical protein
MKHQRVYRLALEKGTATFPRLRPGPLITDLIDPRSALYHVLTFDKYYVLGMRTNKGVTWQMDIQPEELNRGDNLVSGKRGAHPSATERALRGGDYRGRVSGSESIVPTKRVASDLLHVGVMVTRLLFRKHANSNPCMGGSDGTSLSAVRL